MIDAERSDVVSLLFAAGRCNNLRTEPLRDLDRGEADTACGRMNEDGFALPQASQFVKRVVGRHEDDRHARRLRECHRIQFGYGEQAIDRHGHVRAEAVPKRGNDSVADAIAGHTFADCRDDSCGLDSQPS